MPSKHGPGVSQCVPCWRHCSGTSLSWEGTFRHRWRGCPWGISGAGAGSGPRTQWVGTLASRLGPASVNATAAEGKCNK